MNNEEKMTLALSKLAAQASAKKAAENPETKGIQATKDYLHKVGAIYWPYSFEKFPGDALRAMGELLRYAQVDLMQMDPARAGDLLLQLYNPETSFVIGACAYWADQAYPVVQYAGHKYTAALMSTSISQDIDVQPPWPAFLIEVPEGLVFTRNDQGDRYPITLIMVLKHHAYYEGAYRPAWSFEAFSKGPVRPPVLHRHNVTLEQLRGLEPTKSLDEELYPMDLGLDSEDDRTLLLLSRLVVNTCLAMSNPEDVKPVGKHYKGWSSGPFRGAKYPIFRTYRTGHPVEVDCRPALQSYLAGEKRNPLAVQFLVRGHWRNQACGPQLQERKTIWIKPHWKGPEDSPIVERPHILKETSRSQV